MNSTKGIKGEIKDNYNTTTTLNSVIIVKGFSERIA